MNTQLGTTISDTNGLLADAELLENEATHAAQNAVPGTVVHMKNSGGAETTQKPALAGAIDAAELIRLIFDEEDGTVFLYDLNSGEELGVELDNLGDIPEGKGLYLDKGDEVFAVVVPNKTQATFSVADGQERIFVAVLEEPVKVEDVDESIAIDHPPDRYQRRDRGILSF